MRHHLSLALAAAAIVACSPEDVVLGPPDGCDPGAMRCEENRSEICGSDKRWVTSADCNEVAALSGGEWRCDPSGEAGPYCALVGDGGTDGD